jgi:MOSC domain-containing protein
MKSLGTLRHVARYPVKSMRGEELRSAPVGLQGLPGDRLCAFVQTGLRSTFPWLTGRELPELLRYQATYEEAGRSPPREATVQVTTPAGERLEVGSEALREEIERASGRSVRLHLDHRGNHDSAYVSLITAATLRAVSEAAGVPVDHRRFRMNFVVEGEDPPFSEKAWVGKVLRLGSVQLAITELDRRCMMITLDPDSGAKSPGVLRVAAELNGACAGVYASVLAAGEAAVGDALCL